MHEPELGGFDCRFDREQLGLPVAEHELEAWTEGGQLIFNCQPEQFVTMFQICLVKLKSVQDRSMGVS